MEIASLRLVATEDDLNNLLAKLISAPSKLRDLRIRVIQDRLSVTGVYETFLPIPFESFWNISICDGKIAAQLSGIKAIGLRVDFLKTYVADAIGSQSNLLQRRGEAFLLDLDRLVTNAGFPLRTNLAGVRCERGELIIESG
jgi:hypothetical protein